MFMARDDRRKQVWYVGLILLAVVVIWYFQLEDEHAVKSGIRHFIRALVRAI